MLVVAADTSLRIWPVLSHATACSRTHRHLHLNLAHGVVPLDDEVVEAEPVDVLDLVEGARDLEGREWSGLALELGLEAAVSMCRGKERIGLERVKEGKAEGRRRGTVEAEAKRGTTQGRLLKWGTAEGSQLDNRG